ncbi:MAG: tetratricopeptide repeat-containing sensor histidine kinase [Bacteroidetes bacterium]|nr:tetratricopeptide repeat-containing sensor histidine kinase [Bacteroidota bacterium]
MRAIPITPLLVIASINLWVPNPSWSQTGARPEAGSKLEVLFNQGYDHLVANLDSGLAVSERLLGRAQKQGNREYEGYAYYLRAEAYVTSTAYHLAAPNYEKAINIFEELDDSVGLSSVYNGMGVMYHDYGKYHESAYYFKRAMALDSSLENDGLVTKTNIARALSNLGQHKEATALCKQAMATGMERSDSDAVYLSREVLADVAYARGDMGACMAHVQAAKGYWQRQGNLYSLAANQYYWADLLHGQGKHRDALAWAEKGRATEQRLSPGMTSQYYYQVLEKAHAALGNRDAAYAALKGFLEGEMELREKDQTASMQLMQKELDFRVRLEKENLAAQMAKREAELRLEDEKYKSGSLALAMALSLLVLGYLVWQHRRVVRLNGDLRMSNERANGINEKLREQNVFKEKLIGVIAHDTRSPLASLSVVLELISAGDLGPGQRDEILKEMGSRITAALRESEGLIGWAKAQLNGLVIAPTEVALGPLLEEVSEATLVQFKQKNLKLELDVVPRQGLLTTDANLLRIVLKNLITNAAKFSYDGGTIRIKARANQEGSYDIAVEDDGMGMEKTQLAQLFKPDTPTRRGTHNEKGSGLGLLQCQEFIEKMGGHIRAESRPEGGSTFTVHLVG